MLFPNPFPYPRHPQKLYGDPAKYFKGHDEAKKVAEYRQLIREIARLTGKRSPSILDVGSGRGELVYAAQLEGLTDVVGLEFAHAMVAYARDHYRVPLIPQTIEAFAATTDRTFDAVVLNAVLEHVYNPASIMQVCARLTTVGSILFIDTPNEPNLLTVLGNAMNRIRRSDAVYNLSPTWVPYHVFGFNSRALRVLLEKYTFEVIRLRIHASPLIPSQSNLKDRLAAFIGTQVGHLANISRTASNMYVWARRCAAHG